MRLMVAWLRPAAWAIPRVLQCVAPRGVLSSVRTTTCSVSSSVMVRGAPGRGSSYKPARRSHTNRVRHLPTVAGVARSRWATPLLSWPSAQANTMRARRASAGTERDRWARDSNSRRSSHHHRREDRAGGCAHAGKEGEVIPRVGGFDADVPAAVRSSLSDPSHAENFLFFRETVRYGQSAAHLQKRVHAQQCAERLTTIASAPSSTLVLSSRRPRTWIDMLMSTRSPRRSRTSGSTLTRPSLLVSRFIAI